MRFIDFVEAVGFLKTKSCPCCHSIDTRIEQNKNDKWRVRCTRCTLRLDFIFETPIKAVQKWNKRYESKKFKITKIVNGKLETHTEYEEDFYKTIQQK